jgi:glucose/arabinose dehydrogenase
LIIAICLSTLPTASTRAQLTPHPITLQHRKAFALSAPRQFDITPVAEGLKRPRFMAISPDGRLFVTELHDKTDNKQGRVVLLTNQDPGTRRFGTTTTFIDRLRNPNSILFVTDAGKDWLYVATTDTLFRYPYRRGSMTAVDRPQPIATFPGFGVSYKYGGWHLTRTLAMGPDHKLYVSIGSGCDACDTVAGTRAVILQMDLDGNHQRVFASGLRNAVGLRFVGRELYASNMGEDDLGLQKPDETIQHIVPGAFYGWPYYYQDGQRIRENPKFKGEKSRPATRIPLAFATLSAHSAPLGIEFFDNTNTDPLLSDHFRVALHGTLIPGLKRGYSISRVGHNERPIDIIGNFREGHITHGRPVDILNTAPNSFYFTDDYAGVVYYVSVR